MQQLSTTDIANNALMMLGQRKIQSITDQTDPNAIACNVAWNQAFGSVARETPWNCLKAIAFGGRVGLLRFLRTVLVQPVERMHA